MTLSSSLNAGVAGLNVNSSKLGSISDNIANSQTNGYKRAETDFSSLVVSPGGKGTYTGGGVRSSTFREVDQRGGVITTGNSTDIAIGGRGMIPVTPSASIDNIDGDLPVNFVTTGSFRPDENGFLKTPAGLTLMGWPADVDGTIPSFPRESVDGLEPVRINNAAGNCTSPHAPGLQMLACGSPWNQQCEFTSDMGYGYSSPIIRGDSRTPQQL